MANLLTDFSSVKEDLHVMDNEKVGFFLTGSSLQAHPELHYLVEENATLDLTIVDFSSSDLDLNVVVELKRNASANVSVAAIDSLSYQKIFSINVNHAESDSFSRVKMAGINAGNGRLKFLGNSTIVNGAHRSDTRQEGKITNLSPDAKSAVSPALLIKENDVKASHGAALGAYNENELFYLMSRGLTMDESKKLITYGSLLPIIEALGDEKVVQHAKDALGALDL